MLIGLKEACERLKVHPNTMYKYLRTGQVIGVKSLRGDWEILASSVLRLSREAIGNPIDRMRQLFRSSDLLIESCPTPMVITARDIVHDGHLCPRAHILGANESMLETLSYRRDVYYQKLCHEMYHPDESEIIHDVSSGIKQGHFDSLEIRLRCAEVKYLWFRPKGTMTQVGNMNVLISTFKRI